LTTPLFHFRFSTLLGLRQSARDQCRLRLAEARRADAELETQLAQLCAEQRRTERQQRRAAAPGQLRLDQLAEAGRYAAALHARQADLLKRREVLAAETECRRRALLEADRDVRSLEKLRDRDQQRHQLEAGRLESRQLDEVASGGQWLVASGQ
jgi:flagellar export protein FliJ